MLDKDDYDRFCGFLRIDEMDKRKNFQRRYFLLDKPNGLVKWFENKPTDTNPSHVCGMINIYYITKVDIVSRCKTSFCFVINTPFRPYHVQAANQNELEEWVEVLNDASRIVVPPEALVKWKDGSLNSLNRDDSNILVGGNTNNHQNDANSLTVDPYTTDVVGGVVVKKPKENLSRHNSDMFIDEQPIKSGWATKQGHIRKNWKRRYFKLFKGGIAYYKTDKENETPVRSIPMCEIHTADEDATNQRENLLFMITADKLYYIQAESRDEMVEWIESIRNAIDMHHTGYQNRQDSLSSLEPSDVTKNDDDVSAISYCDGRTSGSYTLLRHHNNNSLRHNQHQQARKQKDANDVKLRHSVSDVRADHRFSLVASSSSSGRKGEGRRSVHHSSGRGWGWMEVDVDERSGVKPSLVARKKHSSGILFALNTMLHRKQEKMKKDESRDTKL